MTISPRDSALDLAARGLPILPLRPRQKVPEGMFAPRGSHAATTDSETIRQWWHLSPALNLGVALPRVLVIDIDPRSGGDVFALPDLPDTWRSITGGGGAHIWLRLPSGARITGGNKKLGCGIDIKSGRGSYVVAPPSRTDAPYRWQPGHSPDDLPLATAPGWLIRRLTPPPAPPPRPYVPRTDDERRVRDALRRIPADDRDVWVRVGMALKSHFGDGGRDLWDDWAATCPEKYDPKAQARVWRSLRRDGIGLGTIFHLSSRRAANAA